MEDSVVKFGRKQLKNPTPASWSGGINAFTVILGVIIAWLGTATYIPSNWITISQSIGGLLLALANGLKPFIGVNISSSTVPTDSVNTIETDEIKDLNTNNNNLKKTT